VMLEAGIDQGAGGNKLHSDLVPFAAVVVLGGGDGGGDVKVTWRWRDGGMVVG
jgi:hypothetical protein